MDHNSVCIFGDSIAKGVVLDEHGRYIHSNVCFAELLGQERPVENLAVFGCRTGKGRALMERFSEKLSGFGSVLLMFGGNDSDYDWSEVEKNPDGAHDCRTPMKAFIADLKSMVSLAVEKGVKPFLVSTTPFNAKNYFKTLTTRYSEAALLKFLGDVVRMERWNTMYNLALFKLAHVMNLPIIDVCTPLLARKNLNELLCEDGIHPNEAAHKILFETVSGALAVG